MTVTVTIEIDTDTFEEAVDIISAAVYIVGGDVISTTGNY
jgi:hypothetical protein